MTSSVNESKIVTEVRCKNCGGEGQADMFDGLPIYCEACDGSGVRYVAGQDGRRVEVPA